MNMTGEVGRLQKERQALEQQIAELFTFYAKQKSLTAGLVGLAVACAISADGPIFIPVDHVRTTGTSQHAASSQRVIYTGCTESISRLNATMAVYGTTGGGYREVNDRGEKMAITA